MQEQVGEGLAAALEEGHHTAGLASGEPAVEELASEAAGEEEQTAAPALEGEAGVAAGTAEASLAAVGA